MECPSCGKRYEGVAVFCPGCGKRLLSDREVAATPMKAPSTTEEILRRERRIYLLLTLIPLAVSIIANIILVAFFFHDRTVSTLPLYLTRALIFLPAVGVMIYAVVRLGMFLEFDGWEWIVGIVLVLLCVPISIIYMLVESSSRRVEMKYVGRIYDDEEFAMTGYERKKPGGSKKAGRIYEDEEARVEHVTEESGGTKETKVLARTTREATMIGSEKETREGTEGPVFRWLGTAGFRITCGDKVILIDPYLTRNDRAFPFQELGPGDMKDADYIFLSHGHFDHIADIPAIMEVAKADIYCSSVSGETLVRMGVPGSRIHTISGGDSVTLEGFTVSVTACEHIKFDLGLIVKTVPRLIREIRGLLPHLRGMPAGPVLNTFFDFGSVTVLHLGSLGLKPGQVKALGVPSPDILFIPLQGHSDICRLAAKLAATIRPRAVVPEHHDDFFPPVSQLIDVEPFRLRLKELLPECAYYEPTINKEFDASDVFGNK